MGGLSALAWLMLFQNRCVTNMSSLFDATSALLPTVSHCATLCGRGTLRTVCILAALVRYTGRGGRGLYRGT